MRRLVVAGVFLEAALLIVGLTWIRPAGSSESDGEPVRFRSYGEGTGNVVNVRLDTVETVQEIAPDVKYHIWTFGGTAPGPVIRVQEGDTIRFTLTNRSELGLSHSIDFHAAQTPWDKNYQPVAPGETLTFDWVARFPGVFMYHCGVPPVLHHIANGMYGAIIVEPKGGLPPAREYVLTSSEFYAADEATRGVLEGDVAKMEDIDPTYVVFNGGANRYLDEPLEAEPGELVRLWVMNAGPTLTNAFHVIGALFDRVYADGNPASVLYGLQTYNVAPGAGAMFELTIPDEGMYPFVTHSFAYTGLGSVGVLQVSRAAPPAPADYPMIADPFDGGLTETVGTVNGGEQPTAPATEEPPTEPTQAPSGGEAVSVNAAITGFDPSELEAHEGTVTVTYNNVDAIPHDFAVDELGVKELVDPNTSADISFEASPGTYAFYCSIPGHREAGMEGTLTVLPAAGH